MRSETAKNYIQGLLNQAAKALGFDLPSPTITVPEPRFGDYSSNAALVLAKQTKANPVEIAEKIIAELKNLDVEKKLSAIENKGGFINFSLSQEFLLKNLNTIVEQGDLFGASLMGEGKTIVVEYFQNNVAKPPHVGHLRSAVIGDSLLRILRSQGYKAVSDTHIGDWGTQFGILLYAFKTNGNKEQVEKDPINELNKLYVEMSAQIEKNPELKEKGKEEFAKLERGDGENRALWQWFVRASLEDFEEYRELLGVLPFDHNLGESFYEDKMPEIIADLKSQGLLVESEGAQIVNLEDKKLGIAVLVKSDGATTYLLRDLATIKYRLDKLNIAKGLYVVDNRQSHHFEQAFEISARARYLKDKSIFEHIDFGFMSLPEGTISTRKGTTISLQNLLDEANKRALAIIDEKNPDLQNKSAIANEVALAAIKYFDLSHNRKTEIVFTWDKALSFDGNTGPYLQYTHARIQGILRKSVSPTTPSRQGGTPLLKEEGKSAAAVSPPFQGGVPSASGGGGGGWSVHELTILRKLQKFPEMVQQVAVDYFPNNLCNYLFELSQSFNAFYQEVPVLQEPDEKIKEFRLQLITATAQVLRNGLYLLGIEAPEEM